jgi:hypothetical protein
VNRLVASGAADIEWRAIVRDPGAATSGEPVTGALDGTPLLLLGADDKVILV